MREIPFSVIQFPILEALKSNYRIHFKNNIPLESWEVAICGSIAGKFSFFKQWCMTLIRYFGIFFKLLLEINALI